MAPTSFKAVFPPAPTKRSAARLSGYTALIKNSLTLSTLLVLGGLAQTVVSFILPPRYALLPVVFLLLRAAVLTALDTASATKYASKLGVIAGRTSAQLPRDSYDPLRSETASPFGSMPAEKGIVVFNLGARINHPLGLLAPGAKEFADQFAACNSDLLKRAKELGCLGGTTWHGAQTASNNTIMSVYYFRDLDGLNRFAHDPVHRQAWDWFTNVITKKWGYSHIGIFHEAFCAPAGAYETIYINMPPVLMAAGHASIKNEATGEDEWVPTMVEATGSVWRSQFSRMGKAVGREAKA